MPMRIFSSWLSAQVQQDNLEHQEKQQHRQQRLRYLQQVCAEWPCRIRMPSSRVSGNLGNDDSGV